MSTPVTALVPAAKAHPDLFAANLTSLLNGQWQLSVAQLPRLTAWLFSSGLTIALVIGLTFVGLKAYRTFIDHLFQLIDGNLRPDAMARVTQRTNTLKGILTSLGRAAILFLGAVLVLSKLGVNVAPVLASAGLIGVAVGFGAQSLVKDVISGFFILIEDQYGVGDVIELAGKTGVVERMNLRITQVRAADGQLITVPNGAIQQVVNHSKDWARAVVEVGVGYGEDPARVSDVLSAIGEELRAELPEQVLEPLEVLGVEAFRDAEVVFKVQIKTQPADQWMVARTFRRKVWERFRAERIEVPLPEGRLHPIDSTLANRVVPAAPAPSEGMAPGPRA